MILSLQKLLAKSLQMVDPRETHVRAFDFVESMLMHYTVVAIAAYRHAGARDERLNRFLYGRFPWQPRASWRIFLKMLAHAGQRHFPEHFRDFFLAPLTKKISHPNMIKAYDGLRRLADPKVFSLPANPIYPESISCSPLEFFEAAYAYRDRFSGRETGELPDSTLRFASTFLKGAAELCAQLNELWLACPVYTAKRENSHVHTFFLLTPFMDDKGIDSLRTDASGMKEDRLFICFGDRGRPEVESLYPAALLEKGDMLFASGADGLNEIRYAGHAGQKSFTTSGYQEDFKAFLAPFAPPPCVR